MRNLIALTILTLPMSIQAQEVKWNEWKPLTKRMNDGTYLADLVNHTRTPILKYDLMTNVHETTHMVNSDIRVAQKVRHNGFYVGKNKCVIFKEPKSTLAKITPFIPAKLRGSRFNLYLIKQQKGLLPGTFGWNDQPLYILDEWTAYCNGADAGLQNIKFINFRSNLGEAPIEFMVYAIALSMSLDKHDPKWVKANPNFRAFVRWQCLRSFRIYDESQKHPKMKWDGRFYSVLKSKAGAVFRNYMKEKLNLEVDKLLK